MYLIDFYLTKAMQIIEKHKEKSTAELILLSEMTYTISQWILRLKKLEELNEEKCTYNT